MKAVLITGVNRGISKTLAKKYLAEKYRVIGTTQSGKVTNTHPLLYMIKANRVWTKRLMLK